MCTERKFSQLLITYIQYVLHSHSPNFKIKTAKAQGSCEWVDHNLEVVWVEVEQILQLKLKLFV